MRDREEPRHGLPRGEPATLSRGPRGPPAIQRRRVRLPEPPAPSASRAITAPSNPERPDGFPRARIRLRPGSHPNNPGKRS